LTDSIWRVTVALCEFNEWRFAADVSPLVALCPERQCGETVLGQGLLSDICCVSTVSRSVDAPVPIDDADAVGTVDGVS
jgi:hypothetical protein